MQASAQLKDLVVCEIDLPWLSFGRLAAVQEASLKIFEDRLRRSAERSGSSLDRVGPVRPARWIGVNPATCNQFRIRVSDDTRRRIASNAAQRGFGRAEPGRLSMALQPRAPENLR